MKRSILTISTGALLVFARPLLAQDRVGAERSELRNPTNAEQCTLAASAIRGGITRGNGQVALQLRRCDVTGPTAIASQWDLLPSDQGAMDYLISSSRGFADKKLLGKLLQVASDRSRPEIMRLAAIGTLASFINPNWGAFTSKEVSTPQGYGIRMSMASASFHEATNSPIDSADIESIRATAKAIMKAEPGETDAFALAHTLSSLKQP
ncbi:MAG: hypothetical protein ABJB74_14025 [Gemmatimonas sp.]